MKLLDRIFSRETASTDVLRLAVCALLFTHGAYRLLTGEAPGLGAILKEEGFPASAVLGYLICIAENRRYAVARDAAAGSACDADPVSHIFHRHHAISPSQWFLCRWPGLGRLGIQCAADYLPAGDGVGEQDADVVLTSGRHHAKPDSKHILIQN
jgi:hypothetical protein